MIKLLLANLKMMVRERQTLFWSLMFPLMFTVIFGFFFGGGSGGAGTLGLINNSNSEIASNLESTLKENDYFKIKDLDSEDEIKDLMKKNQVTAGLVIPETFGEMKADANKEIKFILDQGQMQANTAMIGFVNQYLTQVDYQINNIKPAFTVKQEKTNDRELNYFDFVLMGLIGMALMNSSIQGIAIPMANYREKKILKRITTTPLPSWKFVMSEVLSRLVLNLFQVGLILAAGYYFFDAHIYGKLPLLFVFSLIGGMLFQTMGFMVAALAKTTNAAEGMSVAVTIPMMFLAGVFFPIDQLPKWLFSIVQYLPLAPLLRMIRQIGLDDISPFTNPVNIVIVVAWIIFALLIAIWKFKLSEE